MSEYGVIIARFQVPELHLGHTHLIREVLNKHNNVLILLGVSASAPTDKNPLSFNIRKKMLQQHFPTIDVEALHDIPDNDKSWSNQIDHILKKYDGKPILYGSRKSFIPSYYGIHKVNEIQSIWERSGSDIRQELIEPIHSSNFRAGVIHGIMTRYPIVYPTVDIAVLGMFDAPKHQILLCRKQWESKWRFPGGFTDPTDESFLAAAQREKSEELGMFEVVDWKYVGSAKIPDLRYKGTKDSIMTSLFSCQYVYGRYEASDDIAEVKPFDLSSSLYEITNPIHHSLLKLMGI